MLAKNIFNENLLMAVASLGAFAIGEYSEGCAVVLLYTVGEFLQSLAVQKSRRSIKGMLEQKPDTVRVQAKGAAVPNHCGGAGGEDPPGRYGTGG